MKIVDAYPPNIDKIAAALPGARRKGVLFTYGPVIYAPHGVRVSPALKAHEGVHSKRQAEIGAEQWWDQYITDKQFRFHEELLAHRAEYDWWRTFRAANRRRMALYDIAQRLSSDLYGSIVSRHEATCLLIVRGDDCTQDRA